MSNLKKILALVLALVMSFSLVTVSSAAFEDVDDVNAKYEEAIAVLSGLKVFNGRTATEFAPKANITRAEVAAIIYRVVTGDVAGKQVGIYADYNKFDDVDSAAWYAGYVNYCANAEYVKGVSATEFQPDANVTGYQVLAMILRAVGYDKAGEFTGPSWDIQTAAVAKKLGVTKNVNDITLSTYVSREVVAELLFRAINVPQVTYTLALGYNDKDAIVGGTKNPTLGYDTFYLTYDETVRHDEWGRPYHIWFKDAVKHDKVYNDGTSNIVCFLDYVPVASYNTAVSECDVAVDLGLSSDKTVALLTVNGVDALGACNAFNGTINRVTKDKMGAQGRLTEIYLTDAGVYEVVMIDEFLAYVEKVTEVEYDKNGHISEKAELVLTVYDGSKTTKNLVLESTKDWTWNVGDYLIINAKTNNDTTTSYVEDNDYANEVYNIVGAAESMVGGQTAFTTKASHIVEGVEYTDAVRFHKDDAFDSMADHTWFFDTNGNMIGNAEIDTVYSFGTITAIKWVDSNVDLTDGYALATITYVDGTTSTEKVYMINGNTLTGVEGMVANYATGDVSSTKQYNETLTINGVKDPTSDFTNVALYSMTQDAYGRGLVLRETEELKNPSVETGVPTIASNMKAGNATMFLVWNASTGKYETYTGIKNVPSYVAAYGYFWGFDKNKDNVAEYVFISESRLTAATSLDTYFIYGADLEYTTVLDPTVGEYYYIITGGFVNGEAADLYVPSKAAVEVIKDNAGKLLLIETTNGFLSAYEVVTDAASYVKNIPGYVVYAGAAFVDANDDDKNDNILSVVNGQNVLIIDGEAYDIEGTPVITNVKGLNKVMDKDLGAYVYVVYTKGVNNEKAAKLIYITNVKGEVEVVEDPSAIELAIEELKDALAELKAALKAAQDAIAAAEATYENEFAAAIAEIMEAVDAVAEAYIALNEAYAGLTDEEKAAVETEYTEVCALVDVYVTIDNNSTADDFTDDKGEAQTAVTNVITETVEAGVEAAMEAYEAAEDAEDEDAIEAIEAEIAELYAVAIEVGMEPADIEEMDEDFAAIGSAAKEEADNEAKDEELDELKKAAKAAVKALEGYETYKKDEAVDEAYDDLIDLIDKCEVGASDDAKKITTYYDAEKGELKEAAIADLVAAIAAAGLTDDIDEAIEGLEDQMLAAVKAHADYKYLTVKDEDVLADDGIVEALEAAVEALEDEEITTPDALTEALEAVAEDLDEAADTYVSAQVEDGLPKAKKDAVTEIEALADSAEYTVAEWTAIEKIITDAVAAVLADTKTADITAEVEAAKTAVSTEAVKIVVARIGTALELEAETANNASNVETALDEELTDGVTIEVTVKKANKGSTVYTVVVTGAADETVKEEVELTVTVAEAEAE